MKQITPRFGTSDLQRLGRHRHDLRLASRRTQGAVAAGAGLAESKVRAVEAARATPNLPTVVALADVGLQTARVLCIAALRAMPEGRPAHA